MKARLICVLAAACSIALPQAVAATEVPAALATPAQSIDDGLGDAPRYDGGSPEVWVYSQPAAKQDGGLAELPAYAEWREPWVFAHPAPKVDNGLSRVTGATRVAARGNE